MDQINRPEIPANKFKSGDRVRPIINPNVELMVLNGKIEADGWHYKCRNIDLGLEYFYEFELELDN